MTLTVKQSAVLTELNWHRNYNPAGTTTESLAMLCRMPQPSIRRVLSELRSMGQPVVREGKRVRLVERKRA